MNNLAVLETENKKELMEYLGQTNTFFDTGSGSTDFPTLRVNYDDEDRDGNRIPRGEWTFPYNGQNVYAPTVDMRIMLVRMQYSHYNQEERNQTAVSIYFSDFNDKIADNTGGYKCGKLPKNQLNDLSEAEKKHQSEIKLAKVCFGFVSCSARTAEGGELEIENYPVVFYARATHYMPMARYLENLTRQGKLVLSVITQLDLSKKKRGSVTYWEVVPSAKSDYDYNFSEDQKTLSGIEQNIKEVNNEIMDKFEAARAGDVPFEANVIDLTKDFDDEEQE